MRPRTLLLIGVGTFVLVLCANVPAAWVVKRLPPSVQFVNPSGSLLAGAADGLVAGGQSLGPLEWSFRPLALLTLGLGFHVTLPGPALHGEGNVALRPLGRVVLSDLKADGPLEALVALTGAGGLPQASGSVVLKVGQATVVHGWPVALSGTVAVNDLKVALNPARLGSYEIVFDAASARRAPVGGLAGRVHDTAAPLALDAALSLAKDRTYRLEGTLGARPTTPADLLPVLDLLAPADAAGRRPFSIGGAL